MQIVFRKFENMPDWPDKVKTMQKLIGRSVGCEIHFKIESDYENYKPQN